MEKQEIHCYANFFRHFNLKQSASVKLISRNEKFTLKNILSKQLFRSFKHKCCLHEIFKWLINGDKKFRQFTNCAHTVSEGFYAAIDIFREINHFIAFGRP